MGRLPTGRRSVFVLGFTAGNGRPQRYVCPLVLGTSLSALGNTAITLLGNRELDTLALGKSHKGLLFAASTDDKQVIKAGGKLEEEYKQVRQSIAMSPSPRTTK